MRHEHSWARRRRDRLWCLEAPFPWGRNVVVEWLNLRYQSKRSLMPCTSSRTRRAGSWPRRIAAGSASPRVDWAAHSPTVARSVAPCTFLVTPDRPVRLHRIRNDQLYHRHLGDALEVLALYADGSHGLHHVGPDVAAGEQLQLFLPGGTFHTARLRTGGSWFLGASTEWPGVEPTDVELGTPEDLATRFDSAATLIEEFCR
jgi:predicted cupin superfamily sugar epimerase